MKKPYYNVEYQGHPLAWIKWLTDHSIENARVALRIFKKGYPTRKARIVRWTPKVVK